MELQPFLDQLYEMGFRCEVDGNCVNFEFEGVHYLLLADEDDERFFRIVIPGIYEIEDNERYALLSIINELNRSVKYAKAFAIDDTVIITCEVAYVDGDNIENLLRSTLLSTMAAFERFGKLIRKKDEFMPGNDDSYSDTDDEDLDIDDTDIDHDTDLDVDINDEDLDDIDDIFDFKSYIEDDSADIEDIESVDEDASEDNASADDEDETLGTDDESVISGEDDDQSK